MKSGILDEVVADCRRDSGDVTDVLNDSSKRDRNDSDDSRDEKACIEVAACEDIEYGILILERPADPCCVLDIFDACKSFSACSIYAIISSTISALFI